MLFDQVIMFKPRADVLPIPEVVGPQYIDTVQVLPHGVILYRRVSDLEHKETLAPSIALTPKFDRCSVIGAHLLSCVRRADHMARASRPR